MFIINGTIFQHDSIVLNFINKNDQGYYLSGTYYYDGTNPDRQCVQIFSPTVSEKTYSNTLSDSIPSNKFRSSLNIYPTKDTSFEARCLQKGDFVTIAISNISTPNNVDFYAE